MHVDVAFIEKSSLDWIMEFYPKSAETCLFIPKWREEGENFMRVSTNLYLKGIFGSLWVLQEPTLMMVNVLCYFISPVEQVQLLLV